MQVIVVVLADWTVMCFDHNLRMLWSNSVKVWAFGRNVTSWLYFRRVICNLNQTLYPTMPDPKSLVGCQAL